LNRTGFIGAISFKLCGHGRFIQHGVIPVLGFGWRYIPNRLQKPTTSEQIDPRCELHRLEAAPWSTPMDDFGLVGSVDRFSEGVVVTVAIASLQTEGSMPASAKRSELNGGA